ncbi:hypothetical protein [Bradyrhizobium elkanii]|uniref:hypothetical protein n=1 Tax=Bradyrhizobium elkanii TaxID=29448 RepID=UPI00272B2F89|nr:hypothetical protein [Bradyrhizobium elkanii]WLA79553.1 hypothetical protein QNJ99_29650 [Bradyrhizobium elkanii]
MSNEELLKQILAQQDEVDAQKERELTKRQADQKLAEEQEQEARSVWPNVEAMINRISKKLNDAMKGGRKLHAKTEKATFGYVGTHCLYTNDPRKTASASRCIFNATVNGVLKVHYEDHRNLESQAKQFELRSVDDDQIENAILLFVKDYLH